MEDRLIRSLTMYPGEWQRIGDRPIRFRTTCPACGNVSEIACEDGGARVSCGECLMERTEVVHLKLERIP